MVERLRSSSETSISKRPMTKATLDVHSDKPSDTGPRIVPPWSLYFNTFDLMGPWEVAAVRTPRGSGLEVRFCSQNARRLLRGKAAEAERSLRLQADGESRRF